MYQIIDTTAKQRYAITWWVSPRPGVAARDNALELRWDGAVVDRYVADDVVDATTWTRRIVVVEATKRETRIEVADVSDPNGLGAYVDELSVVAVR